MTLDTPIVEEPHIGPKLLAAGRFANEVHQIAHLLFGPLRFGILGVIRNERPRTKRRREHASKKASSIHRLRPSPFGRGQGEVALTSFPRSAWERTTSTLRVAPLSI